MSKPLSMILLLALVLAGLAKPPAARAEDPAETKKRVEVLEKQLELAKAEAAALKVENIRLRRENESMRRALAAQPKLQPLPSPKAVQPAPAASGYWLSSSGKRHNSTCRYYQKTKGKPCGPSEGEACKICGG